MLKFNPDLVDDFYNRRIVLFIGSGVSANVKFSDGFKFLDWPAFLKNACSYLEVGDCEIIEKIINKGDYLIACELLQKKMDERWGDLLLEYFGRVPEESHLHDALKRLNQRIIVTTNFDKVIEKFWNDGRYNGGRSFRVVKNIDRNSFRFLRNNEPVIIKLHGCIDESKSIIFSKSGYIRGAFANIYYSRLMENFLLNYTILFVGFSMNDPAIVSLMELYKHSYDDVRPHWIIHPNNIGGETIDINDNLRRLKTITYDPVNNHEKLAHLINDIADEVDAKRREKEADILLEKMA